MPAPPPPPRLPAHPHHSLEEIATPLFHLRAVIHRVGRPRAWRRATAAGAAPAFRAAAAPARIISRPAPECIQAGGKALYWNECAEHLLPAWRGCADGQQGPGRRGGQATQGGGAMQHAGLTPSTLCCSIGCQQLCCTGDARRELWPRNCRRACLTSMTQPCTVLGSSLSDP